VTNSDLPSNEGVRENYNWVSWWKKQLWPNWRHFSCMCVEEWRKTTKTFSHNSQCSDDTPNWQMLELLLEFLCLLSSTEGKGKTFPLQARRGPEGSRKLRFPYFMTTAQDAGRFPALRTGRLYPQEILLVIISVRGQRPQGHSAIGRILCQWKIHWHQLESNQRPSDL